MCGHEEILDNEGYVCIKCGLVTVQEYIYEENSFNDQIKKNKDIGIYRIGAIVSRPTKVNPLDYKPAKQLR